MHAKELDIIMALGLAHGFLVYDGLPNWCYNLDLLEGLVDVSELGLHLTPEGGELYRQMTNCLVQNFSC